MVEELKGFWIALAISATTSFPIMRLLAAIKSNQTVSVHAPEGHQAKQGTPTMGGFIILAGVLGSLPFMVSKPGPSFINAPISVFPVFVLLALFALIGFVDDYVVPKMMPGKRGLGWKQKIVMQVFAAAIPLVLGGQTDPKTIGFGIFLILFFANAYNFSDGLDGLAGTLLIGLLVGMIGMVSYVVEFGNQSQLMYSPTILFVFLGAVIPFLFWNAPKAKVFMGDVGSLPIASASRRSHASIACICTGVAVAKSMLRVRREMSWINLRRLLGCGASPNSSGARFCRRARCASSTMTHS